MSNRWEQFARENPAYFIDTTYTKEETTEQFFKSGQAFTAQTMDRVEHLLPDKKRALEIGAGIGRLTIPHAQIFEEVNAVDIAPTMLQKLDNYARQRGGTNNINLFLPQRGWDEEPVSYAYSFFVLQHIDDFRIIESYLNRIAGCLKKNGIAQLQFDTRRKNFLYRIRNVLPDIVLPKNQKKGIRRIRRNAKDLRNIFEKYGLEIKAEIHPESKNHIFLLSKLDS